MVLFLAAGVSKPHPLAACPKGRAHASRRAHTSHLEVAMVQERINKNQQTSRSTVQPTTRDQSEEHKHTSPHHQLSFTY